MQHTKGEWKVIFLDRNTTGIMIPFGGSYPESQQIADAYLKAAAPDLYDVVERIITDGFISSETLSMALDAINKAKPSIAQVEQDRNNILESEPTAETDDDLDRQIE